MAKNDTSGKAERLADLLGRCGLSNNALAKRADLTEGTIRRILAGRDSTIGTIDKIANALRLSRGVLLGEEEVPVDFSPEWVARLDLTNAPVDEEAMRARLANIMERMQALQEQQLKLIESALEVLREPPATNPPSPRPVKRINPDRKAIRR